MNSLHHCCLIHNFLRVLVLNVSWQTKGVLAWASAYGIFYVVWGVWGKPNLVQVHLNFQDDNWHFLKNSRSCPPIFQVPWHRPRKKWMATPFSRKSTGHDASGVCALGLPFISYATMDCLIPFEKHCFRWWFSSLPGWTSTFLGKGFLDFVQVYSVGIFRRKVLSKAK